MTNKNVAEWVKDDVKYTIKQVSWGPQHYCGYCTFPKRFAVEGGYDGILTYVPVHGGITYADESDDSMTYGFDCGHCDDENNPQLRDIEWLKGECERMASAIKIAAEYEPEYLLAKTNKEKARILEEYHKKTETELGAEFDIKDNFGTMIRLLCGEL